MVIHGLLQGHNRVRTLAETTSKEREEPCTASFFVDRGKNCPVKLEIRFETMSSPSMGTSTETIRFQNVHFPLHGPKSLP